MGNKGMLYLDQALHNWKQWSLKFNILDQLRELLCKQHLAPLSIACCSFFLLHQASLAEEQGYFLQSLSVVSWAFPLEILVPQPAKQEDDAQKKEKKRGYAHNQQQLLITRHWWEQKQRFGTRRILINCIKVVMWSKILIVLKLIFKNKVNFWHKTLKTKENV